MIKRLTRRSLCLLLTAMCAMSASAYDIQVGRIYYLLNTDDLTADVTCKDTEEDAEYTGHIVIPETIRFSGNVYRVTGIGESAFEGCSKVTAVTIPTSITHIDYAAFNSCYSLAAITIPGSVTSIGEGAFSECHRLQAVNIPASVTSIGKRAFASCYALTSLTVAPENPVYDSRNNCNAIIETATGELVASCNATTARTIPDGITAIKDWAFHGCSGLPTILIPQSVTAIGEWVFAYCCGITSMTIPDNVTTIGRNTFAECRNLKTITIGKSVTNIGEDLCAGCNNATDIYCRAEEVPTVKGALAPASITNRITLHVPATAISKYKADPVWSKCKNIVAM